MLVVNMQKWKYELVCHTYAISWDQSAWCELYCCILLLSGNSSRVFPCWD